MTERELSREATRRLAIIRHVQEMTGNVAATCRYYGISRQSFYKWLRRYEELGPEGLRDRSRRPHVSPNATRTEVVGKILYLRRSYHFGPHKISMYLGRYHDVVISPSGVWRDPQAPWDEPAPRLCSATGGTPSGGGAMRSLCRGTGSSWTSSSSLPWPAQEGSTTSSPRSMTAPGSGS